MKVQIPSFAACYLLYPAMFSDISSLPLSNKLDAKMLWSTEPQMRSIITENQTHKASQGNVVQRLHYVKTCGGSAIVCYC